MNLFNQITKQISDLIMSMTPTARIMAGLMVATIVVSLGWLVTVQQSTRYEFLLGGKVFTEGELVRIEQAFGDAALPDYQREGLRIKIPTSTRDVYMKALNDNKAVPEQWHSEIQTSLNSSNPFESVELVSLRLEAARERELARIIERMPTIDYASVEYDEKRHGFARNIDQTASVQVQSNGRNIEPALLRNIALTTKSYFAGLKEENVFVTDLGGTNTYRGSSNPNAADQHPYLQAQAEWEAKYLEQFSRLLNIYGDVKLAVSVDLDPTLKKDSEKLSYDPTVIALQQSTSKKDSENNKLAPGGRPGTDPNAISNQPQSIAATPQQTAKSKETAENQQGVTGHEAILTSQAGLVPQRVSVTIGVPQSYYKKVWNSRFLQENPDKKDSDAPPLTENDVTQLRAETETSVRASVEGLLRQVREGDDRHPLVSFYDYPDLPLPAIPEPSTTQLATTWLAQSWSTLALVGLVLVSMLMMFSWSRSPANSSRDKEFAQGFGVEVPANAGDELDLGEHANDEASSDDESPTFAVTGGAMKEDLSTLIKQNPDVAANLLKTWIGEAA